MRYLDLQEPGHDRLFGVGRSGRNLGRDPVGILRRLREHCPKRFIQRLDKRDAVSTRNAKCPSAGCMDLNLGNPRPITNRYLGVS